MGEVPRVVWAETVRPVRAFPSYRGQRSFPGLYYAATMDAHVGFESWAERDVAMMLDFLGEADAAARIDQAVRAVLADGRALTPDLGGSGTTRGVSDAVLARL